MLAQVHSASGARAPPKADHRGLASLLAGQAEVNIPRLQHFGHSHNPPLQQRPAQSLGRTSAAKQSKDSNFGTRGCGICLPLEENWKKLERFGNARRLFCPRSAHVASRAPMNGMKAFEALANPTMLCVRKLYRLDQETLRSRITWRC